MNSPTVDAERADPGPIKAYLKSNGTTAGRYLRLAVGLGLLGGIAIIVQAWLLAGIVKDTVFDGAALDDVWGAMLALLGVFFIRAAIGWSAERVAFQAAAGVKREMRARLARRLIAAGPIRLAGDAKGALAASLVDGIEALEGYYARFLPAMALMVMIPLAIVIVVFPSDWLSGLIMIGTAPFIPLFMILIGAGAERLNRRQWRKLARMGGHFLDAVQGLTTLKLFGASRREAALIAKTAEAYRLDTMKVLRVAFLSSLALEFFATISVAVVAVLIGFRLLWGEIDFFHGFMILLLAPEFYLPLRNMGKHYHARMEAIGGAERLLEIENLPVPPETTDAAPTLASPPALELKDVRLDYEGRAPALQGLDISVGAGETLALVGASGAGKSSVLNLLLRFVEPSGGRIRVDGADLTRWSPEAWRRHIAWVGQRPSLFQTTIAANIAMREIAPKDWPALEPAVRDAARRAGLLDVIDALPDGMETVLGDKGHGLSGGQAQRLAVARAFFKDAPLILLDEPTAHLDPETERRLARSLAELCRGRTAIVVAHRPTGIQWADRVCVLDGGRVVEAGTPEALAHGDGPFQRWLDQTRREDGDA